MYSNFSKRVIKTINSLPSNERPIITAALMTEQCTMQAPASLTPLQALAYTIIRSYMMRDPK